VRSTGVTWTICVVLSSLTFCPSVHGTLRSATATEGIARRRSRTSISSFDPNDLRLCTSATAQLVCRRTTSARLSDGQLFRRAPQLRYLRHLVLTSSPDATRNQDAGRTPLSNKNYFGTSSGSSTYGLGGLSPPNHAKEAFSPTKFQGW